MGAMKALGLAMILLCAACAKKPAARATTPAPTGGDVKEAPAGAPAPAPAPGAQPPRKANGDPCSGGEQK
jgi:hypothetical protein